MGQTRSHRPRDLSLGRGHLGDRFLGDLQGLIPDLERLTQFNRVELRQHRARFQSLLKHQVEIALRLGEPAPAIPGEAQVPFVPHRARWMLVLDASGHMKGFVLHAAGHPYRQWRVQIGDVGDLAAVFRFLIPACNHRMAEIADGDQRRADLEGNGAAACRANRSTCFHGTDSHCTDSRSGAVPRDLG